MYVISSKIRHYNQRKLEESLSRIQEFLTTNYLTVNMKKTKLTETMIKQKRGRMAGPPPELKIVLEDNTEKVIKDEKFCRILGLNIQDHLTWQVHLESGCKALLPDIRKKIGALRNLGCRIPAGSRNILARGLVISKLSYLVSIWGGGATPNYRRKAQSVLNLAARWVTGLPRQTRASTLMEAAGWNTIEEMTIVSAGTLMWKIINKKNPLNLYEKLSWDPATRKIEMVEPRLKFTEHDCQHRASKEWNSFPNYMRENGMIQSFKKQLKALMLERREQRESD